VARHRQHLAVDQRPHVHARKRLPVVREPCREEVGLQEQALIGKRPQEPLERLSIGRPQPSDRERLHLGHPTTPRHVSNVSPHGHGPRLGSHEEFALTTIAESAIARFSHRNRRGSKMLQLERLKHVLTEDALREHADATPEALAKLPLSVLVGLDEAARRWLAKQKVRTLGDMMLRGSPLLDDPSVPFEISDALYCAVVWPTFDSGPSCAWTRLFGKTPLASYDALPTSFRRDFGPVHYRGRLDGTARVLVVGQDPSTDELLAQRILVGKAGQRVQRLLRKLGLTRSYVMLNAFVFGVFGQYGAVKDALASNPTVGDSIRNYRNLLFDRVRSTSSLQAILSFGVGARESVDAWPGAAGIPRFDLYHPTAPDDAAVLTSWNGKLTGMAAVVTPDAPALVDLTPCLPTTDSNAFADVPRRDLPFGLPSWHGTGGATHSQRNGNTQINWTAV
jgi:hypothetical protein